jgi:hypothetical protein
MKYCLAALLFVNSLAMAQESSALPPNTRIPLPNVNGRMDHFSVDVILGFETK